MGGGTGLIQFSFVVGFAGFLIWAGVFNSLGTANIPWYIYVAGFLGLIWFLGGRK